MGTLVTTLRNAPKRTSALVAMVAAAVIVPAALFAWGPDRPTYTVEHPADHITFNSITNNPNIGDERNFVGIRETGSNSTWSDDVTVQPGKSYTVRMYVHNNAASELNLVAENVTAKFNLPTNTAKSLQVNGFLDSSNATPNEVYDHATFNSTQDFNLAYTKGTLKYENNAFGAAGTPISESVFTSAGALLGYDKLDGKIPGCFQYAGYLTFQVTPQFAQTANHTVTKEVSKHGANQWVENYAAKPGETVDYLIQYKNVGQAQNDNVMISDKLPAGESYVAGSTILGNTLYPSGLKASDNITGTGINIGSYGQNGGAWIIMSAKVADNDSLPTCGVNTLVNTARATTDYGWKEDTATVTVTKTCVAPKQIQVCNLTTKQIVTINENQFDSKLYSMNVKDCASTPVTPTTPTTPTTPATPAQLPHTGAGDGIAAALSLGSIIASVSYYVASRRGLLSILSNR